MLSLLYHKKSALKNSLHTRGKYFPGSGHMKKTYPRFPHILLSDEYGADLSLRESLASRHSAQTFNGSTAVSLQKLGSLFSMAARDRKSDAGVQSRSYPSGGALYPLEIYVARAATKKEAPGLFHYNPALHALETLFPGIDGEDLFTSVRSSFFDPWTKEVPLFILISSVWHRTLREYGDFGYRLVLAEAGHLAQNILLSSTALGLLNRPCAGFDADDLSDILDLEETRETVLYAVALGDIIS